MSPSQATATIFWTAFQTLSKRDKKVFVKKLLDQREFMEDIADTLLIEQRKSEPSRPLDAIVSRARKRGGK